jgi:hypothetical protein
MEVDWGRLLMALVFGLVLDLYILDLKFVCINTVFFHFSLLLLLQKFAHRGLP